MAYVKPQKKSSSSDGCKASESKKKRMKDAAVSRSIPLDMSAPNPECKPFERHLVAIYGPPGVGKSKFVQELGFALQEKYDLELPAVYMLQCEPVNHQWKIRGAKHTHYLDTWPTFCQHVDDIVASEELQKSVKMFVLDTADSVIPKLLLYLQNAYNADTALAKVEGGNIHTESQDEFEYQLLRLWNLGIGVLILSHERSIEKKVGPIDINQARMDLSGSMFNRIADRCGMVLHMRQTDRLAKAKQGTRCLVSLENDSEHAKDNLGVVLEHYDDGVIEFRNERQAVDRLLECFGSANKVVKKSKKCKKKTSKKKTVRR